MKRQQVKRVYGIVVAMLRALRLVARLAEEGDPELSG
jgi:hypothetical protein